MSDLRAAIVGAGRLGSLHAQKYVAIPGVRLSFVADIDKTRAIALAEQTGATALDDHRELKGRAELATIAVPGVRALSGCARFVGSGHRCVDRKTDGGDRR